MPSRTVPHILWQIAFAKALELEGEFQVGEAVSMQMPTPRFSWRWLQEEQEEVNELTGTGEADQKGPGLQSKPLLQLQGDRAL